MKITIVGAGMGGPGVLTGDALRALTSAGLIIGARRLLEGLPADCTAQKHAADRTDDILALLDTLPDGERVCILMSGDTGFYSGAGGLLARLGSRAEVIPGVSSVQYFAARLRRPWQDWKLVSAHGRDCDAAQAVSHSAETFFLTGGKQAAAAVCARLAGAGLGKLRVTVGENLGTPEERIRAGTALELSGQEFAGLSVLLVDNPVPRDSVSCGWPDDAFTRGKIPMTKREVRAVILSKLRLRENDAVWDIGAGTGSVAVEAALLCRGGHVYAVEREPEGCRLIAENAGKFGACNVTCVSGEAPAALEGLPAPDAVFIGGSGGKLSEILEAALARNPSARLVVSAVTLETLAGATAEFSRRPIRDTELIQLSVSRAETRGSYHLLTAQNPVFLLSGVGGHD